MGRSNLLHEAAETTVVSVHHREEKWKYNPVNVCNKLQLLGQQKNSPPQRFISRMNSLLLFWKKWPDPAQDSKSEQVITHKLWQKYLEWKIVENTLDPFSFK